MTDYIVEHALSNVWCTPDQDTHVIIKLARITPGYGAYNHFKMMWIDFNLPIRGKRFHVFQIGEVHPLIVNLFDKSEKWVKLSDCCELTSTVINLYSSKGVMLPRYRAWYLFNEENVIFIAIEEIPSIDYKYTSDDLYFRAYRNAFFNSTRSATIAKDIVCYGQDISLLSDIHAINQEVAIYKALPGDISIYCNGKIVPEVTYTYVKIGDCLEFLYDASIKLIVDYSLKDLITFDSLLDKKGKYLLHYDKQYPVDTIDYSDDIDLYLIDSRKNTGLYFHKNDASCFRSITYRDYSVNVANISAYINSNTDLLDYRYTYIRMHIRHSGYKRLLSFENNRVNQLYKLNEQDIQRSMLAMDSVVDVWRADNLENSTFSALLGMKSKYITPSVVAQAYGFHALMKYCANAPIDVIEHNSQRVAPVPYIFRKKSTAFEYDQNGVLIDHYIHSNEDSYIVTNANAKYVEFIFGIGSDTIDEYYNVHSLVLDDNYDYHFYYRDNVDVSPNKLWRDVTGSAKYAVIDKVATWLDDTEHEVLIRSNKNFLLKTLTFMITDGIMKFNISNLQTLPTGIVDKLMLVPMGELDVFLNGRLLIKNLDYYFDFPVIRVVNKSYLINPDTQSQKITIRYTGLCRSDLTMIDSVETGFIRNSVVSNNRKYNIHDDKVCKVYIDGRLFAPDDVHFNEDGNYFILQDDLNGRPYQIVDSVSPLKGLTNVDTYLLRENSLSTDKQISDYLTIKIPELSPGDMLNPMLDYHYLFSPFMNKIIVDLKSGLLSSTVFSQRYSDADIVDHLKDYMYLLARDPAQIDNMPNSDYIKITPHCFNNPITLTVYQYSFIMRVNKLLCNNIIDITDYIVV